MKRKLLLAVLAVAIMGSSLTVYAQPKTMPDGTVFDAEFYAETYPDVKAAFGKDEAGGGVCPHTKGMVYKAE